MYQRLTAVFLALSLVTAPALAADDDVLLPLGPSGEATAPIEEYQASDVERELAAEANADSKDRGKLAEVKENWGFFIASDIGFFLTFGGAQGYSYVQPYIGFNLGYDFSKWISLQLAVANGFSSGNGIEDTDSRNFNDAITSYQMTNLGLQVVGRYLPHERVALELKLGGGASRLSPLPRSQRPADDPYKESGWQGHIAVGLDVKYITLLTDFSAGLDITFYYILPAGVPSLAITPSVRYTF